MTRTIALVACTVAIVAASVSTGLVQSLPTGTGLIVGQVVDGTSGRPVRDAMVDLITTLPPNPPPGASTTRVRVVTDQNGRYYFADLPAGRYNVRAVKPGYLAGSIRRPAAFGTQATSPVELADGQKVLDWTLKLWRYGVISGTVLDEAGEPAVGIEVRALRRSIVGGRPRFTIMTGLAFGTTDDRGMFRMAQLPPGDYAISVPSTMTSFPASVMEGPTSGFMPMGPGGNEFSSASREISILGGPNNQKIGDAILMTLGRAPRPPAPVNGRVAAYLPTFYPATSGAAPSTAITLAPGAEQAANIQLRLAASVNVSGTLSGPSGPLAKTALRLVPVAFAGSTSDADQETATGVTDDAGRFTLLGVPTGQYLLKVLTPRLTPANPIGPSTPEKPILWAAEPLTVGDADLTSLAITARPTLTISGRVQYLGPGTAPEPKLIANWDMHFDSATGGPGVVGRTDEQGAFVTGVPGGRYTLNVETPTGWRVKSIDVDGRDATDGVIEIKDDARVVIGLTDQPTHLSGLVRDERGAADAYGFVGVFPVRRDWWVDYPVFGWRVRGAETSATGAYAVADLPAGDYFVASIPDTLVERWRDPAVLDVISRTAVRVTIADGEKRVQDLRKAAAR